MNSLLKLFPCLVFIDSYCSYQLTTLVPDFFKLVIVSKIGIVFIQPLRYFIYLFRIRFIEEILYQQVIVNMVEVFFQGFRVVIVLV